VNLVNVIQKDGNHHQRPANLGRHVDIADSGRVLAINTINV
jgi:hypothetical protein